MANYVAVIGGGLVGSMCAAMLASRGFEVVLYESRPDPRRQLSAERARSINLALSPRGIEALRAVNDELADRVLSDAVPMRGRMIHHRPKSPNAPSVLEGQDYGIYAEGEYINSISRTALAIELLNHLDGLPRTGRGSVSVNFDSKLVHLDLRAESGVNVTIATRDQGDKKEHFDFVIGADGAYSQVRRHMTAGIRFDLKQYYAAHCYLELSIPPGPNNTFSMSPNHLHIWPRGEFMLIALPNPDKSFTLTLFAHKETFDDLETRLIANETPNPLVKLFSAEFPDALKLITEEGLLTSWKNNPKDGLITVECFPYHYRDKVLLIGDAAHAMVPFYGQGMNCGFEDVRVLSSLLDYFAACPTPLPPSPLPFSTITRLPPPPPGSSTPSQKLELALQTYARVRAPSLGAIQALAAANYAEMASTVLSPLYLLRRTLDSFLSQFFTAFGKKEEGGRGGTWESLYRMVTFRYGLAYEEVMKRRAWQANVLTTLGGAVVGGLFGTAVWIAQSERSRKMLDKLWKI